MEHQHKCAHPACACITSGDKYCGTYCELAKDRTEIACNCQHQGCATEAQLAYLPAPVEGAAGQAIETAIVADLRRDPEDRRVTSFDDQETKEKMFDKTLADSYPASDPPSSIPDPSEDSMAS